MIKIYKHYFLHSWYLCSTGDYLSLHFTDGQQCLVGRCLWGPTANPSNFPSEIYPSYIRTLSSYQFAYFAHICNTVAALRLFQHHSGFGAPKHQEWGKTSLMPLLFSSLPFSLTLKNCTQLCPKDLDHNSLLEYVTSQKAVFLQVPFAADRAQHFEKTETITADAKAS